MRFLHTADWHLGRMLHGVSLIEDQRHVLRQVVELCRTERVEAVLVAGDVFDRAIPPVEAVALLDEVLTELLLELRLPVVVISGNHDARERLAFGARLLRGAGLHMLAEPDRFSTRVELHDAHGPVVIEGLPYLEPVEVRPLVGDATLSTHDEAMAALLEALRRGEPLPQGARRVLLAHCFVEGGRECRESERPLSVGGAGRVAAARFSGWDYVALGHLHAPQKLGRARYSGSLLKYSFDEADQRKGVLLVDVGAPGTEPVVEEVPLRPLREVRRIAGRFEELLRAGATDPRREDFLSAEVLDTLPILNPRERLREVYPNLLEVRRPTMEAPAESLPATGPVRRALGPEEEVEEFFRYVLDRELEPAAKELVRGALKRALQHERSGESGA